MASAMPVLPDVGSTSVVLPGAMSPRSSASRIMLSPIRSLTLLQGSMDSSLTTISALQSGPTTRRNRQRGVPPMSCVMSSAIFGRSWSRVVVVAGRAGGANALTVAARASRSVRIVLAACGALRCFAPAARSRAAILCHSWQSLMRASRWRRFWPLRCVVLASEAVSAGLLLLGNRFLVASSVLCATLKSRFVRLL